MILKLMLALALQLPTPLDVPMRVVNTPRLVAESMVGKAATAQLKTLQTEKQKALSEKQLEVQKLAASRAVTAQIEKAQLELQRLTLDAEAELASLDRQLQEEFDRKLRPVVAQIAEEDHIGIVFEYPQQMIVWAAPAVDITSKVIERLDAATKEKR
jgi:Skp family chaperone for outer membrane proteins